MGLRFAPRDIDRLEQLGCGVKRPYRKSGCHFRATSRRIFTRRGPKIDH
jgi:hypothetical protein